MKFTPSEEIFNAAFESLTLSEETTEKIHAALEGMLVDVDASCRKRGIKYMLSGGTCLGAVRHKGFIPWDDDVDLMAYYPDVYRIGEAVTEDHPDKYEVKYPYENGPYRFMKIYLRGTVYTEIRTQNMPVPHELFIDVFPIVWLHDDPATREKLGKKHYYLSRLLSVGYDSKYPSSAVKEKMKTDKEFKKYYSLRFRLGRIARLMGLKGLKKKVAKLERGESTPTATEGIPTGIAYTREVFAAGFLSETIEAEFNGHRFFIPANYDGYLKNLYGDYMRLPPPEKRRRHMAIEVSFGENGEKER